MSRTYRRDWWYGNIFNAKRPWTDHEIEMQNAGRSGHLWFDPTDEWNTKRYGNKTLRAFMVDRWTDKRSGCRNAPKHFRQMLTRRYRSRVSNEIRTFLAQGRDIEDFYITKDQPHKDAAWMWF